MLEYIVGERVSDIWHPPCIQHNAVYVCRVLLYGTVTAAAKEVILQIREIPSDRRNSIFVFYCDGDRIYFVDRDGNGSAVFHLRIPALVPQSGRLASILCWMAIIPSQKCRLLIMKKHSLNIAIIFAAGIGQRMEHSSKPK